VTEAAFQPKLEWQVVLARRQPKKALIALAVVMSLLVLIEGLWGSSLWTGIAAMLFFCAIGDFFFPLRLSVGPEGVSSLGFFKRQRLRWEQVAECVPVEDGFWIQARNAVCHPERSEGPPAASMAGGRFFASLRMTGIFLWAGERQAEIAPLLSHYRPEIMGKE